MEFTLHTPEGFYGRIYTFGHYDRCFFRGSGGTVNILRISGSQGHPPCGSQRVCHTLFIDIRRIDTGNYLILLKKIVYIFVQLSSVKH